MDPINPWLSIWSKPKATILQVVSEDPKRGLWILAFVYGVLALFNVSQALALGYVLSLFTILFFSVVLAPIWGIICFWIWSGIVYWVGKLFKGKGNVVLIRAAYAWSCTPLIWSIVLWCVMLFVFGVSLFQNFPENYPLLEWQIFLLFGILVVKMIIAVWSFVIFINALAAVQQFSIGLAILNIVVSWIVLVGLALIIWLGISSLPHAQIPLLSIH